jgi:hypothetical protein
MPSIHLTTVTQPVPMRVGDLARDCPDCFIDNRPGMIRGWELRPDGTFVRHIQSSLFTGEDDRNCAWQRADHQARRCRLFGHSHCSCGRAA